MRLRLHWLLFIPLVACSAEGNGHGDDDKWDNVIAAAQRQVDELGVPGFGIAVVVDGKVAYAGGVGVRSLGNEALVTQHTVFRSPVSGLVSTTLAALRLESQGRLDRDAPIGDVVPEFGLAPGLDPAQVTLHHLLCQTAGLPSQFIAWDGPARHSEPADYYATWRPSLMWTPGEHSGLSIDSTALTALAIEHVAGEDFALAMAEILFGPLGMDDATFDVASAVAGEHADGTLDRGAGHETHYLEASDCENMAPFFLNLSAADAGRLIATMVADDGSYLPANTLPAVRDLGDSGLRRDGSYHFGYGLDVDRGYPGFELVTGSGVLTGFRDAVVMLPERGFAVVVLANGEYADVRALAMEAVRQWFPELPVKPAYGSEPATWGAYVGRFATATHGRVRVELEDGALAIYVPTLHGRGPMVRSLLEPLADTDDAFEFTDAEGGNIGIFEFESADYTRATSFRSMRYRGGRVDDSARWEAVRAAAQAQIDAGVPGMAIALVADGAVEYTGTLGVRELDGKAAVTPLTAFRSVVSGVLATNLGALRLEAQGKLDRDAPLTLAVPEFGLASGFDADTVTLHHVLSMTSGLPTTFLNPSGPLCVPEPADYFASWRPRLLWTPGEFVMMGTRDTDLVGLAIEHAVGKDFIEAMAEVVFEPLDMSHATFSAPLAASRDHADGTVVGHGAGPSRLPLGQIACDNMQPWRLHLSIDDAARFIAALIHDDGALLPSGAIAAGRDLGDTGERRDGTARYGYFAGWDTSHPGYPLFGGGGMMNGFTDGFALLPYQNFAVVVLANSEAAAPDALARTAMRLWFPDLPADRTYGTPPAEWDAYVGTYHDPIAGDFVVRLNEGHLVLNLPGNKGPVELLPVAGTDDMYEFVDHTAIDEPAYANGVFVFEGGDHERATMLRAWRFAGYRVE